MSLKKMRPYLVIAAAVICLACAVLLFVFAGKSDATYKRILGIICGALLVILSGLFTLYWYLGRDTEPNFFLFLRREKRNMPIDKLTPLIVNERMTFFMGQICDSPESLWSGDVLENERNFGYRSVYKPLVAYKMLYDLGEKEPDSNYWNYLKNASPETIDVLCMTLERAGEAQLVKAFRMIREKYPDDDGKMKEFLRKNVPYIRGKMLVYVKKHIELFY